VSLFPSRRFKIKTLDEVPGVSRVLAESFPFPEKFRIGIHELLINAIEHGNLGIGFEEKTALLREEKWEEETRRRMALPEYRDRDVDIRLFKNGAFCCLSIADRGNGFLWREYLRGITSSARPNGRGLLMVLSCGFDRFAFNASGNRVACATRTP
jgi:hypothetical protein